MNLLLMKQDWGEGLRLGGGVGSRTEFPFKLRDKLLEMWR